MILIQIRTRIRTAQLNAVNSSSCRMVTAVASSHSRAGSLVFRRFGFSLVIGSVRVGANAVGAVKQMRWVTYAQLKDWFKLKMGLVRVDGRLD